MLQDEYYKKSAEAYSNKDHKLCLILLKKIIVDEPKIVALSVNCAYDLWKLSLTDNEQQLSTNNKTSSLTLVKESFAHLLDSKFSSHIAPYDYIRLSHIYLAEGSLDGALQILNLASARGHLESTMVVLQSWTIMTRLMEKKESDKNMVYLVSAILSESDAKPRVSKYAASTHQVAYLSDSPLPLAYAYLHCAEFMRGRLATLGKAYSDARRKKERQHFITVLSEAYYLLEDRSGEDLVVTMKWFQDADLWLRMGDELALTPFLLLSEDSYWEGFVRAPLLETSLRSLVASMRKYHRGAMVPALLGRAMDVNPWNVFCRDSLREAEEQLVPNAADRQWGAMFDSDYFSLSKIQSAGRGWLVRRHWPARRQRAQEIRKLHMAMLTVSDQRYALAVQNKMLMLLGRWRSYVYDYMWLKYNSATRIQAWARKISCVYWYAWARWRVNHANSLFIVLVQRTHDFQRIRPFRRWFALFAERRRHKSATVLVKALQLTGYSQILAKAMEFLLSVIRVTRRHTYKRMFGHWMANFRRRQRNHARISIRFFVRGAIALREERALESKILAGIAAMNAHQLMLDSNDAAAAAALDERKRAQLSPEEITRRAALPMLRDSWSKWWFALNIVRRARMKESLSRLLAMLFKRSRERRRVRAKRVRLEAQTAFVLSRKYSTVARIFLPWKHNAFVLKIQRFVRKNLAKRRLWRLNYIKKYIKGMAERRRLAVLKKTFRRIQKANYLLQREMIRASRQVVRLFRIVVQRARLRKKVLRKIRLFRLLEVMHLKHLALNFRELGNAAVYASNLSVLLKYFRVVRVAWLRRAFCLWSHQTEGQRVMTALVYRRVMRRTEKKYWVGVSSSVAMRPLPVDTHIGIQQHPANVPALSTPVEYDPYEVGFKPWEMVRPEEKVLWRLSALVAVQAFKSWVACFRIRNRFRRGSSNFIASVIVEDLVRGVSIRRAAAVRIQCLARRRTALAVYRAVLLVERRCVECFAVVRSAQLSWNFARMLRLSKARIVARLLLQRFVRVAVAHRVVARRRQYMAELRGREEEVCSSAYQRWIVAKHMRLMQFVFCCSAAIGAGVRVPQKSNTAPSTGSKFVNRYKNLHRPKRDDHKMKSAVSVAEQRYRQLSDGDCTDDDEDADSTSSTLSQLKGRNKLPHRNTVAASKLQGIQRSKTVDLKELRSKSFQSAEFHSHLFRLKQSGVFAYSFGKGHSAQKSSSTKWDGYDDGYGRSGDKKSKTSELLLAEEVEYCLQNAETVFVAHTCRAALTSLESHFLGAKVVLSGGYFSAQSVDHLASVSLKCKAAAGAHQQSVDQARLRLHLAQVTMRLSTAVALSGRLAVEQQQQQRVSLHVKELSVDAASLGLLGVGVLLVAMERNTSVTTLTLQLTSNQWLQSYAACLAPLSRNTTLQELRIFGAQFTSPVLLALQEALRTGFESLTCLEFSVARGSEPEADLVVTVAKNRSYTGKGLSIIVNQSDGV